MRDNSRIAWAITFLAAAGAAYMLNRKGSNPPSLINSNWDMLENTSLSRGYRNNNPLNIRKSLQTWKGKIYIGNTDPDFEQFENMAYGYRAALMTMRTHIKKYGLNTVYQIIKRWAPAEDGNNPEGYTQRVCNATGLTPNTVVGYNDADTLTKMAYGMSIVENDSNKYKAANHAAGLPNMEIIKEGWRMI